MRCTIGFTADIFSEFNRIWTANSGIEIYYDKVASIKKRYRCSNWCVITIKGIIP